MSSPTLLPTATVLALTFLGLGSAFTSPAHGDQRSMLEDVHHQLQQALNPGGPTPGDADLKTELKSALDTLRNIPSLHLRGAPKIQAQKYIESALDELAQGDPNHQVQEDIRQADLLVRHLEE